jgi:predicted alpha/beta-hydrolase family hydrolase
MLHPPTTTTTVRAAAAEAARLAGKLPLFAGGKSFGGRMTSQAQAIAKLPGVRGLVFFAFPLHPAGKPATTRADHLDEIELPMLFLQGPQIEWRRRATQQETSAFLSSYRMAIHPQVASVSSYSTERLKCCSRAAAGTRPKI